MRAGHDGPLSEQGEPSEAGVMLMAGLSGMVRGERPRLERLALVALAIACCRRGRLQLGRIYLEQIHRYYGTVDPVLAWGRGKILAALDDTDAALPLLTQARDSAVAYKRLGEAVLVTLDLSYALALRGEVKEAAAEVKKLGMWLADESAGIVKSLMGWWEGIESTPLGILYTEKENALLTELRGETGPGLEPLPFV